MFFDRFTCQFSYIEKEGGIVAKIHLYDPKSERNKWSTQHEPSKTLCGLSSSEVITHFIVIPGQSDKSNCQKCKKAVHRAASSGRSEKPR